MERTPTELTLEDLLPRLEKEHAAEENDDVRDAIVQLINSVEEYLLELDIKRKAKPEGAAKDQ
ncbi:MAG TPA: hypothetical protein VKA46_40920 [Gemmataceae bacterium]|nr:hypothetical protein [Gemmataceae bacterium]